MGSILSVSLCSVSPPSPRNPKMACNPELVAVSVTDTSVIIVVVTGRMGGVSRKGQAMSWWRTLRDRKHPCSGSFPGPFDDLRQAQFCMHFAGPVRVACCSPSERKHRKKREQKTRSAACTARTRKPCMSRPRWCCSLHAWEQRPCTSFPSLKRTGLASEHTEYSLATRPRILARVSRASAVLCHQHTHAAMHVHLHTSNQAGSLWSQDHAGGDYQNDVRDTEQPEAVLCLTDLSPHHKH